VISDKQFETLVSKAIDAIPPPYNARLENVAFLIEDVPTQEQRTKLNLYPGETLFGLYEGVPLPLRGGVLKLLPDKITIFKEPILGAYSSLGEVDLQIRKTIWHEVAHYYGLDHRRIHELEHKQLNDSSGR
jgi:predicted Zn-dependent protease with MMP-like domain